MVKEFSGKTYELDVDSQENMDAFLQAVGVADAGERGRILKTKSTMGFTVSGDKYTFKIAADGRSFENTCKLGEEFDEKLWEHTNKATYSLKGANTIVHVQRHADGKVITSETTYSADKAVTVITLGNVVAKRTFKAV